MLTLPFQDIYRQTVYHNTCTSHLDHDHIHLQININILGALKETTSQTDQYLVSLSSKTHVFEDKMTKH